MEAVDSLPTELLHKIFSNLDRESLLTCSHVCLRYDGDVTVMTDKSRVKKKQTFVEEMFFKRFDCKKV